MHDHSEWYRLATGFWWLIFPIGWGVFGLLGSWIRHREAQQALEVLKSYAEQGKEAPPELIQVLRGTPPDKRDRARAPVTLSRGTLLAGLIFTALSIAFLVLRATRITEHDPDAQGGLLFVVVLMAGFAAAMFITSFVLARDERSDRP